MEERGESIGYFIRYYVTTIWQQKPHKQEEERMIRMKRTIVALGLALISVIGSTMAVSAATTSFSNYKVGAGYDDPYTQKTEKAGGGSFENCFYVTITKMEPYASSLKTQSSMELSGPGERPVNSNFAYVTGGSRESANYTSDALANRYYRMKIMFSSGPSNQVTVSGRYTP